MYNNFYIPSDTITAISTPTGRGAIGIVRLSGSDSFKISEKLFTATNGKKISAQRGNTILHGKIKLVDEKIEDYTLAAIFKAPNSYTGEDMVEFNCHSNPLLLSLILDTTVKNGARLAESGEFTKRAFFNNKLDLTQAEAILNIVNSKTREALSVASRVILGEDKSLITGSVETIENILVNLEAEIDFSEEDLKKSDKNNIEIELAKILKSLKALISKRNRNFFFTHGIRCSILGKPNVGKSTLINTLLGEDRAIVSEYPGTTRDIVREFIDIKGIPFTISDTAGITDKPDKIESIGIEKTLRESESSNIIIVLLDGSSQMTVEDERIFNLIKEKVSVIAINKCDLPEKIRLDKIKALSGKSIIVKISAKYRTNIDKLETELYNLIINEDIEYSENKITTSLALQNILKDSIDTLQHAIDGLKLVLSVEFIAEDLKDVLKGLGSIVGKKTSEDLLNEIFSRFCIGK